MRSTLPWPSFFQFAETCECPGETRPCSARGRWRQRAFLQPAAATDHLEHRARRYMDWIVRFSSG